MARAVGKLAPTKLAALVKAQKPGLFGDGAGLALRINANGAASWVLRYMRQGVAREMGLGSLRTFGLAEAREKARKLRQEIYEGVDPIASRKAAKAAAAPAVTFGQVADMYLTAHAPAWRSETHRRQWRQTLSAYALPALGDRDVAAIDTGAIMAVLEPLWTRASETASRLRGRLETILDFATARGWRTGDNPARWRGHLDQLLPAPRKVRAVRHHAAMSAPDLPGFMAAMSAKDAVSARCLQFLVLTAARSAEARGATWAEIDLAGAVWTVPPARMKASREHRVALSDSAVAVLRDAASLREHDGADALVFPGGKRGRPLSDVALAKLVPAGATVHGFRAAFRTWAAESTNFPREVIEQALAHRSGDAVEQAYQRGDLFQRRKRLMAEWGTYCAHGPAATGAVVPLRAGAAA